ncbi:MAG TPA: response regulator [Caulobacteraceae bacterium]|nr:response regulator [Caulobacteraceae bacterium]
MYAEARIDRRVAAAMERVLIIDAQPAATRLLSGLLRDISPCQIWSTANVYGALGLAERVDPRIVFVTKSESVDGGALARQLRRSDLPCRRAPLIMIGAEATAATIIGARDAGVHEFLRKPFTRGELVKRLEAVAVRPRDWIEGIGYIGPDRRRFNSAAYSGALRRRMDHAVTPDEGRIEQALKILKIALDVIGEDPRQALRAMRAQASDLAQLAASRQDGDLAASAIALNVTLAAATPRTLRRAEIEPPAAPLLARLVAAMPGRRTAA